MVAFESVMRYCTKMVKPTPDMTASMETIGELFDIMMGQA